MLRIVVLLFCLTFCLNGITAKHLFRRSNECPSNGGEDFVCPEEDGMFPHRQCTKFWHCSNCLAYEKDCPAKLYWNDNKQECDYPEDVPDSDCLPPSGEVSPPAQESTSTQNPSTTTTPEPTTTPAQTTTEGTTTDAEDSDTTVACTNTTEDPNEETTTQGSTEETTTEGSSEETTTEGSSEETTTEGSSEETTTEGSSEETTTEGSSEETTTEGATEGSTSTTESEPTAAPSTTEQSNGGESAPTDDPLKPSCDGTEMYHKHSDCTKFWQCSNGIAYEMPCAPGTAWDDELKVCNWPATVNCKNFKQWFP